MELMVRIELTTCSLRMSCSAIEPHQHSCNVLHYRLLNRNCQDRIKQYLNFYTIIPRLIIKARNYLIYSEL